MIEGCLGRAEAAIAAGARRRRRDQHRHRLDGLELARARVQRTSFSLAPRVLRETERRTTAAQYATARVRSRPSGKLVIRNASVDGAAIAAPTPWTARAVRSQSADWAAPAASDESAKIPMPGDEHPPPPEAPVAAALSASA